MPQLPDPTRRRTLATLGGLALAPLASFAPFAMAQQPGAFTPGQPLKVLLGVPAGICNRAPTTDTYSLAQGQDEFYFSLPYDKMDLCLWAKNHGNATADVAGALQLTAEQVERVYRDIDQKRATTRYMHLPPVKCGEIPEFDY